ncbi:hypothetical protein IKG20_01790 [Candidatus Saccharibacteria bacterium]|nr:hypothetical protein [Candidatus Saccharibacteria bacterium]
MNFREKFPVASRLLVGLLILAVLFGLFWGGWAIAYNNGWVQHKPLDFASLTQPAVTQTIPPANTSTPTPVITEAPRVTATPVPAPVNQPKVEDTWEYDDTDDYEEYDEYDDYVEPAPAPVVTAAPATQVVYRNGEEIKVTVDGKSVVFRTFTYHGGYHVNGDPWFCDDVEKETDESYGPPIYGKTPQELAYNWLRELCKSPHQIIRLRTQMGMISPKSLEEENELADELAVKDADEYDNIVNETLQFFFKKLNGGRIESSKDWSLENYMTEDGDKVFDVNLHGRTNHDDDEEEEKKDVLLTFYAKGAKNTFVSSKQGWLNTVKDAKVKSSQYSQRAWVNMTEGGTWKWKAKKGGDSPNPNPKPTDPPSSTPTPTPVPSSRPTKDPNQRPTESDAPVGGGSTNPENSTDPHTTDHVESTPAPEVTPAPTPTPTPVPTAVVRPTEICETEAPTPIREDQNTPPPSDPDHNVPSSETSGTGGTDFDPGSI